MLIRNPLPFPLSAVQLAGLFSRRKPAMPSRDNLLLGGDDLYTQLENDSSDTEDPQQRRRREQSRAGSAGIR